MSNDDFINPDAIAWREENERLHLAGKPHQWRLFGMVACRLCQAAHDEASDKQPDTSERS